MKYSLWLTAMLILLSGCTTPSHPDQTDESIQREMNRAVEESSKPSKADVVSAALLPSLAMDMPKVDNKSLDSKFDLSVSNTPASQVFMAIVSGTRYSMLLHPDVSGSISLNLKDVSVFEALEAIRELYGYDYKVDGTRIYIQSAALQTRIFQVSYLTGLRAGTSSLRVSSGSVSDTAATTTPGQPVNLPNRVEFAKNKPSDQGTSASITNESGKDHSKVMTITSTDFWGELEAALHTIVGNEKGRSVVISPTSGVIVIRAMPDELKSVAAYLKAAQIAVERQVILEAKIIEVQLGDAYQSGVNWGVFQAGRNSALSAGQLGATANANGLLTPGTAGAGVTNLTPTPITAGGPLSATPGLSLANALLPGQTPGSLFGLAFQTSNFGALLSFLESQGNVHVLSSPRIATLNNQKAVLKVGTDQFFVTNVTGGVQGMIGFPGIPPTVQVQPFFSGIALDVTPRIDQNGEIILHVHPSVSLVSTVNTIVNMGAGFGAINLPLASSTISETDSVVRARDGQIVAIGGLMRQATYDNNSGLPGLPKSVFGQTSQSSEKRELVILLKATVVESEQDWSDDITRSRDRVNALSPSREAKP
jgi:MSHA biogenesis protein MshL